ncbi:6-phosphogluconolactonase [Demequina lignilytica]|uniref:6-phosphogluconolactonase n=1 Tax=Demequina lignilytica TaxID=3051663 RepID=A0AB35ML39_9MICO|nr:MULTISPECIES: 6-phosphogluconolactonase [unclassified Demequina]MDN4484468.1 6-phosphogluconolactonase [Demequina sp. SYSU T0a273]MDN4489209.1 6-phosphogluconolactonase [Demequina sp. SYSU T00068]
MTAPTRVVVHTDAVAVAEATAARLLLAIIDTLTVQDRADVVLTGGTVGIATLESAAASPLARQIDWTSVHAWWGDERFVPAGDPDRNEGQAQAALLGSLPLPEENIHRMGASDAFGSVEEAATAYADQIASAGVPAWDVLMLGMGPDGHVASLFPGHPGYEVRGVEALPVHDSPKPPPTRVSLSLESIRRAKRVWVVAAGAAKADVVARALHGDLSLPAAAVRGSAETLWLVDAEAVAKV